jgi:hypothetical protein
MDLPTERDRLHQLDKDVQLLEGTGLDTHTMANIVTRYKSLSPPLKMPLWQLVQDMEQQAAVYSNIVEDLKSGKDAHEVKMNYEATLSLIPRNTLPNPVTERALRWAFKMAQRYATAMVGFIRDFGEALLTEELKFGAEHTATLQVQIGVSPSVTLGTEYTRALDAQQPAPVGQ